MLNWNTQEFQLMFNRQHVQVLAICRHFKTQHTEEPLIEFKDILLLPTIEIYQISWIDNYQIELPPPPIWKEKEKGRAEEKPQLSSLGYIIMDQKNLFYQLPKLICVDCRKKLSTMGTYIKNNKKWSTTTKYYCRLCVLKKFGQSKQQDKWDNTLCLICGKILPDEELWNDVPGRGKICNEAYSTTP
ncbi:hypothetical protein G9A89_021882 [Geosiphon pyriformis]|nr:hypothetical protein G9A89_021882 [Geosiphon pyriformis]